MLQRSKRVRMLQVGCRQSFFAFAIWLTYSGIVTAQDLPSAISRLNLPLPAPTGVPLKIKFPPAPGAIANNAVPLSGSLGSPSTSESGNPPADTHRITLAEAQQMATEAGNPMIRLGQLQVESAKQHRLGVQSMYFPNIGGQLENLHFNKNTGPVLTLNRLGATVPVNIIRRDQTAFNFSAVQPITPLFAIHQLVKIAGADENIARSKAGMPVAEIASNVEKNYFDLLVAQRELISSEAETRKIEAKWLSASTAGVTSISAEQEKDIINVKKAVVLSRSKVEELSASLNEMIGLPNGTKLELVPPEPLVEDMSLSEATDIAGKASPEVVEAEQTAVKARAGLKLAKMQYFPSAAIVGGYTDQNAIGVILPRSFTYIGFIATYTVFDFGKREHGVKEVSAQAEAADLAVQLTKTKAAAEVKSSYLELERSRQLVQLARRMVSATKVVEASYKSESPDVESATAKMEADMFRTELEYRQAYARLKTLIGSK